MIHTSYHTQSHMSYYCSARWEPTFGVHPNSRGVDGGMRGIGTRVGNGNGDDVENAWYLRRTCKSLRTMSHRRMIHKNDLCLDKVQNHHARGSVEEAKFVKSITKDEPNLPRKRFEKQYSQRSRQLTDECKDHFHGWYIAVAGWLEAEHQNTYQRDDKNAYFLRQRDQ